MNLRRIGLAGIVCASLAFGGSASAKKPALRHVSSTSETASSSAAEEPAVDRATRGIYVRGDTASRKGFAALLDRVVAHGMNAIVLDVKDYDGLLTFPSKVSYAIDAGATKDAPMESYASAVRLAHEKGVKVIARISCFNDQLMAKNHPSTAIRGKSGHPYRNGWVDPSNETIQQYIVDLAKEAIANGADEIQLDYVRFPVLGIKNIDFKLDPKNKRAKVEVINAFVDRVHAVTRAHHVPLSLDVFGVIAFGHQEDIENLGQDPPELAKRAEFLSAMVYPSHYDPGFMGFEAPGDHPELVGLGVKHMADNIKNAGVKGGAKIRPWLQAMHHKSETYGPAYIQREIATSDRAGGSGWLLWNPGQVYDVSWRALPRVDLTKTAERAANGTKTKDEDGRKVAGIARTSYRRAWR